MAQGANDPRVRKEESDQIVEALRSRGIDVEYLVKDDEGYLLVVLPSDYHVDLDSLRSFLGQPVELATEEELGDLFPDCELGAVPPLGHAYGIKTIWDPKTTLGSERQVFFEAGDHVHLVRVSGEKFHELMAPADRGKFSYHV